MAEQIVWTSADGATTIDLTDDAAGYRVLADGTRGLRSVTYAITSSTYAGIDGETVDAIRAEANQPTVGLMLRADGVADFRAKARGLVRAMRPKAGPGTLTVANESGERRSLTCYCTAGLEGDESTDTVLPGAWWRLALKFYAPDPWWYGAEQTLSVGLAAGEPFFPFFPLVLAPGSVQGEFAVDLSEADAPTYPVWTITGPGSALVLTNSTTGRVLEVDASLADGETMVIDTRPKRKSVRRGDGSNLMGSVVGAPDLWPLIEDVNTVTAQLTGATVDSRIVGVYRPRFAGI